MPDRALGCFWNARQGYRMACRELVHAAGFTALAQCQDSRIGGLDGQKG